MGTRRAGSSRDPAARERERIARELRAVAAAPRRPPPSSTAPRLAPLALFPLRLEYRVREPGTQDVRATFRPELLRGDRGDRGGRGGRGGRGPGARGPRHLEFARHAAGTREIWWRWFPDDTQAAQGIAPRTGSESAALQRFRDAIGAASWWDASRPEVRAGFAALAGEIGAWRALHLLREPDGGSPEWERDVGRLAVRPDHVALFALRAGQLVQLGRGNPIPDELRLSHAELKPGGWLVDFDAAVRQGMGLVLRDPDRVTAALQADWIVALGLTGGAATDAVSTFLADALANGALELYPPGTPTNRVPGRAPAFEREPSDPAALLALATQRERAEGDPATTDAARLSAALGLDPQLLHGAPGARDRGRARAQAMARVLLPALTESLFRRVPVPGVERAALIDFLAEHAFARGPLPAVRLAHTPYGVLPVTHGAATAPAGSSVRARQAFDFCRGFASAALAWLEPESASLPIVRPDDPQAHEKLEEGLRPSPVSLRVVVRNLPGQKSVVLRCPAVRGPGHEPREYLRRLAAEPLAGLPDPDESDHAFPLLYRLVRYSRELLETQGPSLVGGPIVSGEGLVGLRRGRGRGGQPGLVPGGAPLAGALLALVDVDPDELERLLFELLDLVDHRADAWFTALADCRLKALRAGQPQGLQSGWYGFLGPLRLPAARASDGYVQAPSVAQAITAGMLRSAALRHPGSAFELDLRSRRARHAVRLHAEVLQGATLRQALGDAAARFLHDQRHDFALHLLRAAYPLALDGAPGAVRALDGLAVHDDAALAALAGSASFLDLSGNERSRVLQQAGAARAHVADVLDGFSDLVVAEAAHQLTLGNAGAANAWMQVLSGDPPPQELVFLRTPRDGQGSSYRWALVREERAPAGSHPRTLIDPNVAALAADALPAFANVRVGVAIPAGTDAPDPGEPVARELLLGADLGLEPIDLVIGGESELLVRARFAMLRLWRSDPALAAELGPPPQRDVLALLAGERKLTLDLQASAGGSPTVEELLRRCGAVRELVGKGRALRPQDLAAAAKRGGALDEADMAAAVRDAALGLLPRCTLLEARLAQVESDLGARAAAVVLQARQLAHAREASGPGSAAAASALALLGQRRLQLDDALVAVSHFALPESLRPAGDEELAAAPEALEALVQRLRDGLARRREALAAARGAAQSESSTAVPAWQARVDALSRALRDAADGDALAVWPGFARSAATTPLVSATGGVAAAIGGMQRVRPRLTIAQALAADVGGMVAHRARPPAPTPAPDEPEPTRDDAVRPGSAHEGTFLGAPGVLARPRLCGAVIDEWSDERPSRRQVTGLALNYDSPQAEAPKALLLCVPSRDDQARWDLDAAAQLVGETIRWMRARALPAARSSLTHVAAPLFGVVPPIAGTFSRRRLPTFVKPWIVDVPGGMVNAGIVLERVAGAPRDDQVSGSVGGRRGRER